MTLLPGCGSRVVFVREFPDDILFVMDDASCVSDEYRIYRGSLLYENAEGILGQLTELYPQAKDDLNKDAMERLETVKALNRYAESAGIVLNYEEEASCEANAAAFRSMNAAYSDKTDLTAGIFRELMLAVKTKESIMSEYTAEISDDEARVVTVLEFYAPIENYAGQDEAHHAALHAMELMTAEEYAGADTAANAEAISRTIAAEYPDGETAVRTIAREGTDAETVMLVFELQDGQTSQILRTEDGYYVWYCIRAYDQALCDENKQRMTQERRQDVYERVLREFVAGLDFSLDEKQFARLLAEENTELASSIFEMSGAWQD